MVCWYCGRDIDEIGHDNISPYSGIPLCEDCGSDESILEDAELEYKTQEASDAVWGGFNGG